MTTINHECYVSLEVAKLLKEAGFDWSVMHFYDEFEDGKIPFYSRGAEELQQNMNAFGYYSAPTLAAAQQYLREVKNVDVFAYRNEPKDKFESIVSFNKKWSTTGMCINTYEEALETAIKKALEMILEKGK